MQTSPHISPFLPVKHRTSFSCFLLRTTVDCCGYTLSTSLSTNMTLNLPLILFQAREFEMAILFEVPSWNRLQICAQLTASKCSCYFIFFIIIIIYYWTNQVSPSIEGLFFIVTFFQTKYYHWKLDRHHGKWTYFF